MRPSPIYEASEVEELPISDGVVDGTPAQLDTFDIGTQPLPLAVPDRTVYPIHHVRDALEGVGSGRASGRASARGESLCAVAGPAQLGQILTHQRYERNLSTFSRIFWGRTGFDR